MTKADWASYSTASVPTRASHAAEGESLNHIELFPSARLRLTSPTRWIAEHRRTEIAAPRANLGFPDESGELCAFLHQLTGFKTVEQASRVTTAGVGEARLLSLLKNLLQHGAVTLTSESWRPGHLAGCNPQTFGDSPPRADVTAQASRRKLRDKSAAPLQETPLVKLSSARRSARSFSRHESVSVENLTKLLTVSYSAAIRAAPSAGGLNPCQVRVLRRTPAGWELLIWDPESARLSSHQRRRLPRDSAVLRNALESEGLVHGAAAFIVVAADPSVQSYKYGNRGYRYAVLDAGHIAQMVHLGAVELDLASLEWGAFRDSALQLVCQFGPTELPMTCIAIGYGDTSVEPDTLRLLTNWQESQRPVFNFVASKEPAIATSALGVVLTQIALPGLPGSRATGTGWTSGISRIRALGEAIERDSAQRITIDAKGSVKDLHLSNTFDVRSLYPPRMQGFTDRTDGKAPDFSPFRSDGTYRWRKGTTGAGDEQWVPIELVYYPVEMSMHCAPLCGSCTSNGVAAGTSLMEARTSALYELIERDAFVRSWISQQPPDRFTSQPRSVRTIVERLRYSGCRVEFLAFSSIAPTVGVAIIQEAAPALSYGMATKGTWLLAAEKALQEAMSHFGAASIVREDAVQGQSEGPLAHALQYHAAESRRLIDWFFEGASTIRSPELMHGWDQVYSRTLFVDLSRPDTPLKCVRAISCDLRQIWFGNRWKPADDGNSGSHFFA